MEVKILASILLALRLVAVGFLFVVIKRQIRLLKESTTEYNTVRMVLITLVGIGFIGNFVPIVIDVSTLMRDVSGHPGTLLTAYALSNALTAAVLAIGWWMLYKVIADEQIVLKSEKDKLEAKNVRLTKDNKAMQKREDAHKKR